MIRYLDLRLIFAAAVALFCGLTCFPSSDKMSKERAREAEAKENKRALEEKRRSDEDWAIAARNRDQFVAQAEVELDRIGGSIARLIERGDPASKPEIDRLVRSYEALSLDLSNLKTSDDFSLGEARQSFRAELRELQQAHDQLVEKEG